jgi:hypothetical protein
VVGVDEAMTVVPDPQDVGLCCVSRLRGEVDLNEFVAV